MTAPLGQLPEAHLGLPGGGCGVELFRDRPVRDERFGGVTRREPGPPCVREKLRPEERVQRRGGGCLVGRRGVFGPERVLVRRTEQGVALRSEVLVGLGSRPPEDFDRLLGLALRQPGLREQDARLLGRVGPGEVFHHLRQYAGCERVVLRIEREACLRDLATGTALRGLRGQEAPREEPQGDDERHREVGRYLFVTPDPASEPRQRVGLPNHRASRRRYRRRHALTPFNATSLCNVFFDTPLCYVLILFSGPPSAPGVTRTPGQRFRKPLLYPPELQGLSSGM